MEIIYGQWELLSWLEILKFLVVLRAPRTTDEEPGGIETPAWSSLCKLLHLNMYLYRIFFYSVYH